VCGQDGAGVSCAGDEVDDASGEAGFFEELAEIEDAERGLF
jgi:hypothetical protein